MANFENASFHRRLRWSYLGLILHFWGGNTYPVAEAMSGPNNVRMYGSWNITNSNTGKVC